MKFIKTLKIDINKNNYETIPSVEFDKNARFLHVYLLNNSVPFDLTGCSVKIYAIKADNTEIFNNCKIIDCKKGFVEIELTEQMNARAGSMECELKIYSVDGVLTTKTFIINISKSITRAASITSTAEYNALTDALNKVQGIDNKANKVEVEEKFEEFGSQLDTKANEIKSLNDNKMDKNTKDISVTQINKNLGKFDETYMSESLLAKMTGEGTFGTVPEDKSITNIKLASKSVKANNTDFIKTKNNDLLANLQFVYDKYISYETGEEVTSNTYKCTVFVPVEEGKRYVTNESNHMAYYNEKQTFLKGQQGGTWNGVITIPVGVSYVRLTYTKNALTYLYEVSEDTIYPLETLIANTEFESLIKRLCAKANIDIPTRYDLYNAIYDITSLVEYETMIKNGYYTKDGWYQNSSYNSSMFLEVEPSTPYWSNETNIVVMYDKDFLPIKQLWSSSQWEEGRKFTTTEDTKYITINYTSANIQPLLFKANESHSAEKYISDSFIDLFTKSMKDKNKRIELKSVAPFNVVKDTNNVYDPSLDEAINTAIHPITGAVYTLEGYQASGFIKINNTYVCMAQTHNTAFYDIDKSFISGVTGGWSNPLSVPQNAKYLRTSFKLDVETPRQINEGNVLLSYESPEKVNVTLEDSELGLAFQRLIGNNSNKLEGIIWNVLGDSITSINYSRPNWCEIIKDKYELTVNNYGISGTTLAHTDDRHLWDYNFTKLDATAIGYNPEDPSTWSTGNCMCERFSKMSDEADLITVMGSTNDGKVKLGTWDSTDTSTFYGALNVLIQGLINKYPNKKIAFFTPIQSATCYITNVANASAELDKKSSTDTLSLQLRAEAIKRKCKQYSIPCLDLFNESGINGVGERKTENYRTNDNLHPSVNGNKNMSIVIENFILSLFN